MVKCQRPSLAVSSGAVGVKLANQKSLLISVNGTELHLRCV